MRNENFEMKKYAIKHEKDRLSAAEAKMIKSLLS